MPINMPDPERESWSTKAEHPVLFKVTFEQEIGEVRIGDDDEVSPFYAAMTIIGAHGLNGTYKFPNLMVDGEVVDLTRVTVETVDA